MHKDTNLIGIHANQKNQYINKIMHILFTEDELAKGIVVDDPGTSRSEREPLDINKIDLLKKAAFAKYKVKSNQQGEEWARYKKTANSLCYEYSNKRKQDKHSKSPFASFNHINQQDSE